MMFFCTSVVPAPIDVLYWNREAAAGAAAVLKLGDPVNVTAGSDVTVPAHKERHSHTSFVGAAFLSLHSRVVHLHGAPVFRVP